MGYLETILGYGGNHFEFPLSMLFKKVTVKGEPVKKEKLNELFDNKIAVKFVLQDDIYLDFYKSRYFEIDNRDEYHELCQGPYISKEYGCHFRTCCCFTGIFIAGHGVDDFPNMKEESIEKRIANASKWIEILKEQNRVPKDLSLVMIANCCS